MTQAGELTSLADSGIASIPVTGTPQRDLFEEGNQIRERHDRRALTGTLVSPRA